MSHEDTQEEVRTLGAIIREHREQQGISLADVRDSTKISLPVLRAIENDDHESMPAEAFCRGFYSLYADFLGLDHDEIMEHYRKSRKLTQKKETNQENTQLNKNQNFSNYAEPSSISAGTGLTIFSIICLILIIGICYYFQWNPINYISTKLTPPQTALEQQALPATILPVPGDKNIEQVQEVSTTPEATVAPYHLEMDFNTSGTLKVTIDDGFVLDKHFTAGETLQWNVKKKIILDMPGRISGDLRLNGITIPLPMEKDGRRTLSLPEDLLD